MTEKTDYYVSVSGCDDATETVMALTAAEHDLISRFASAASTGSGGCKPVIEVRSREKLKGWDSPDEFQRVEFTEVADVHE